MRQNEAAGVKINSVGISIIISFLCTAPCCLHAYIHMSTPCRCSLQTKQGFRGVKEAGAAFVVLHVVNLHLQHFRSVFVPAMCLILRKYNS